MTVKQGSNAIIISAAGKLAPRKCSQILGVMGFL